MIELLVMRHAKSAWDTGDPDFHRPLNARGVRNADEMARWMETNDLAPDRVLSSPAVRARSTAMAVVYECGIDRGSVDFEDNLYLADAFTWLQAMATQTCERLLICGHNPGLDELVDHLSPTLVPLTASGKLMTTAAVAHFAFDSNWDQLTAGSGKLLSLTRPADFR